MVVGFTTIFAELQSVPITTNVVSSNPVYGEVYLMQHYVIKFAPGTLVFSNNITDRQNRTEILLKVALNTINQTYKELMTIFGSFCNFFLFLLKMMILFVMSYLTSTFPLIAL